MNNSNVWSIRNIFSMDLPQFLTATCTMQVFKFNGTQIKIFCLPTHYFSQNQQKTYRLNLLSKSSHFKIYLIWPQTHQNDSDRSVSSRDPTSTYFQTLSPNWNRRISRWLSLLLGSYTAEKLRTSYGSCAGCCDGQAVFPDYCCSDRGGLSHSTYTCQCDSLRFTLKKQTEIFHDSIKICTALSRMVGIIIPDPSANGCLQPN